MAVYKRSETKLLWMSYTDENGKRCQVSTGTDDPALAESKYQQAIAEVALKKASQLASSIHEASSAKLEQIPTTANPKPTDDAPDWLPRTVALEKTVAGLQKQFGKLFIRVLKVETNQKKLAGN